MTLPPSVAGTDICAQTAAMGAGRWGSEEARRRKWLLLPGPRSAGRMGADRDRGEAEVNIAGEGRDIQHWHEYVCGKARGPVWPEQGAWKEGGK